MKNNEQGNSSKGAESGSKQELYHIPGKEVFTVHVPQNLFHNYYEPVTAMCLPLAHFQLRILIVISLSLSH